MMMPAMCTVSILKKFRMSKKGNGYYLQYGCSHLKEENLIKYESI